MICLFEDITAHQFYPLNEVRHIGDLLVGTRTLHERVKTVFDDKRIVLAGRHHILAYHGDDAVLPKDPGEDVLFLNARLLVTTSLRQQIPSEPEWVALHNGTVVAALVSTTTLNTLIDESGTFNSQLLAKLPEVSIHGIVLYDYLWDMLDDNSARLAEDYMDLSSEWTHQLDESVLAVNRRNIILNAGVAIHPGVVLDASNGPIILGSGSTIMANSVIEGPCYVGPNSTVKIGSKIYGGCSFGPWCKVGGEVENTIVLGYSNKQHDGFVGHSYIGSWVNLGAGTSTSDLKNNYSEIRVTMRGHVVNTGRQFLGSLFGDHSKTAINTSLNTGTVVGVFANIFGTGFPSKEIPAFSWGGAEGFSTYRIDKALELAAMVMARRNVEFTRADIALLEYLFESTNQVGNDIAS